MRRTKMPDICCKELFVACANKIANLPNRKKLLAYKENIDNQKVEYVDAAKNKKLHELLPAEDFLKVPTSTWNNLYKNHMSKIGKVARDQYDKIKLMPEGVCPFCSTGTVTTLDHFLPKTKFPQYSVLVPNLVGCCQDCNKYKDAVVSNNLKQQLFHPYFESIAGRWLKAEIIEESQPRAIFEVSESHELDSVTLTRAKNQFEILKLGASYATNASNEFRSIEHQLSGLLDKPNGSKNVRDYLKAEADSADHATISVEWKVAFYEAAAKSNWYCSGGFRFR